MGPQRDRELSGGEAVVRRRILVVDDEPNVCVSIRRMLRHRYDVDIAHRGIEALERVLGSEDYALILCDLRMSEMSGLEVLAALSREEPRLAERFVFITGDPLDPPTLRMLRVLEPDVPVLRKPFAAGDVAALADRHIGGSEGEGSP